MSFTIRVTTKGIDRIVRNTRELVRKDLRRIMKRRMIELMRHYRADVKNNVPGRGGLKKYVVGRLTGITRGWRGEIRLNEPGKPYPKFLWDIIIGGSRPHPIVAKNAKALRFFWAKLGKVVFFKSVKHPGTKPNDFPSDVFRRVSKRYTTTTSQNIAADIIAKLTEL